MNKNSIVWFRQDLRINDNPAFYNAAINSNVFPIYIYESDIPKKFKIGAAQQWWLHHALNDLNKSLDNNLFLAKGNAIENILKICKEYKISEIYLNKCYEPWRIKQETDLNVALESQKINIHVYNGSLLWNPFKIKKDDGSPYKVFTPFYRKGCLNQKAPREAFEIPNIKYVKVPKTSINDLELLPQKSWYKKLDTYWDVSENGAHKRLKEFINDGLSDYKNGRNFPSKKNVSKLSPYLHFGQISPHIIWNQISKHSEDENINHFKSELGWREFSYYLLINNPSIKEKNIQTKFDHFPWDRNEENFNKWKKGNTGVPIVDAGMRELWETGYIHNRVRMIVGSFLVKNLLLDWRLGEEWFNECLVDADNASNSASWQWIAGCGADAAPYFRIFNPVMQGMKFDENGDYTKKFVPELRSLPNKYLFCPWECSDDMLSDLNIKLGKDYPYPIVDLKESRDKALKAFASLKNEK